MSTSMGYHTFVKSKNLTQEEATILYEDFKKYRNNTKQICIIGPHKYAKDPSGRHYDIVYPNQYKGLTWKIRFSNKGFYTNGEFKPCSIKVIINPKTLIGEKSYIVAADASYLEDIKKVFEYEAEKISSILRGFNTYSLNRIDYCINFDVSEIKLGYLSERRNDLPKMIMQLIKCGDIPDHFKEEYEDLYQFYLKSNSVVINCYWKHDDLSRNFPDCIDLDRSYNIIRFEVQFRYPKVYAKTIEIKKEQENRRLLVWDEVRKQGLGDFFESADRKGEEKFKEMMNTLSLDEVEVMKTMLSDEKCSEVIDSYFYKVVKHGDYYAFKIARRIIEEKVSKWEKVIRLTDAMQMIHDHGGIAKSKATLQGKKLEDFRRSLRELEALEINPVTIPEEWGIKYIPDLFKINFYVDAERRRKELKEKGWVQMIND